MEWGTVNVITPSYPKIKSNEKCNVYQFVRQMQEYDGLKRWHILHVHISCYLSLKNVDVKICMINEWQLFICVDASFYTIAP